MPKQDRRSMNLPTEVYEELNFLQAEVRVLMKEQNVDRILSKTSITNIVKALIGNTSSKELVKILK